MSNVGTMSDVETDIRSDQDTRLDNLTADGDHERFAHIIRKSDEMKGYAMGEPVVALCGKTWVPTRDPQRFPVCPTCKEVLASLRS